MTVLLSGGERTGEITVPASKSMAHRAVIVSALSDKPVKIICGGISKDIKATVDCLNAFGADIKIKENEINVKPTAEKFLSDCVFECNESGSTLRFLLPLAGALGINGKFKPKGRLIERPLYPLDEELLRHGVTVKKHGDSIEVSGRLLPGKYEISGEISSQYISGLLMALPLLDGDSELAVTGKIQSQSYIKMTEDVLASAGIIFKKEDQSYFIKGGQKPRMPDVFDVEGDYSNAAFYLCMGALSQRGVTVRGLNPGSPQGDSEIINILKRIGADITVSENTVTVKKKKLNGVTVDASQIPDIIPTLCAVASVCEGETVIINGERLRLKESDRIKSTVSMINSLGGKAEETLDGLIIKGVKRLSGGEVDSFNDHRIAMAAAVASCACEKSVKISDSQCVEKSYPRFWDDFESLIKSKKEGE